MLTKSPHLVFNPLEEDELRVVCDRNNPVCEFYDFIGNNEAIETIFDVAYKVLQTYRRDSTGINFAFYGPASTGKTTIACKYAKLLELPFASLAGGSIKSLKSLLDFIQSVLDEDQLEIQPDENGDLEIPAMVVFIDEVDACSNSVIHGLLTACEPTNPYFTIETSKYTTKNIHWIIATTERGDLFRPFETRFTTLQLKPYSLSELAVIVKTRFNKFADDVCLKISKYSRIPRVAISFATQVELASERMKLSYSNAVDLIAKRKGIDPSGLDERQIKVLKFVASDDAGKSMHQLCGYIGCAESEFKDSVIPTLLYDYDDRLPLIRITNRYKITEAGSDFLNQL